jgi:hypothetical protein
MSPHAGAFVTLSEGTITANVVKELRNHATGPPLRLHIQQRNDWTDHTMELINWKAHGKAFNGMIGKRVHLTKLVHELLPTFRRLNKLTKSERKCPACNNAEETRDHIIRCQHDKRARWRTAFMTAIEGFHAKENTSPLLRHVWREAMELWFAADTDVVHVSPVRKCRRVMFAACTDVATAHSDVDRAFELSVHAGDAMQHERSGDQC